MNNSFAFEYLIDPNKRLFWVYIISSILLGILYFYINKKNTRVIMSSKLWLHPSAKLDYYYFFLSYFINIFFLVPFIVLLYTIALFVVSDFTRYWLHRFLHTIPILWEFHKVHHSAKVLTPITFYRVHPVENFLFALRYSLSAGVVTGVFIYFFGAMIDIYMIFGVNVFLFLFSTLGANLRHSHVPFAYFAFIEKWFMSPKQHQIHHSNKYFDKNYGGFISVWDRVFGSLKLSNEVSVMKFGLRKNQMADYSSLKSLLFRPFINLLIKRKN